MTALAWVGIGGAGGLAAIARLLVDGAVSARAAGDFPFGTLCVNLSGAVLLGVLTGAGLRGDELLVGATGALGSYTTFSTWMLETHRLSEDGQFLAAVTNIVLSLVAGLGAVALGRLLGGWL